MATGGVNRWLFHRICFRRAEPPVYDDRRFWERFRYDVESNERFFARFRGRLDLEGKAVLDIGCGRGATSIEAARRGAARVVGVDLFVPPQAHEAVAREPESARRVELRQTEGTLRELREELFDVVLSKDSFEHYADPESFVHTMARFLKPDGVLAIGFGPLWRSPHGGHLEFMTPVPWAHLLFPEDVVMAERRRFRPDEGAESFAEVRGGLNKMTLARFLAIMASSGLDCLYFDTNVSDHPAVRVMKAFSRLPPLRELLTTNVYSTWGRTGTAAAGSREAPQATKEQPSGNDPGTFRVGVRGKRLGSRR